MANDLILKIHQIANSPRQRGISTASDEFPLPEEVPTASEEKFPLLKKRDTTAEKFALLMKTRLSHGQRHIYNIQRRVTVTQLFKESTFGGNEATKKTKKNLLKQQYGNFKAEGSETLEQTFNRLQAIVSHLEFMDIEIEQDDLNQKFLTTKNSSGNEEVNTASIPTASTQVSPAGPNVATASISLDTACAYKKTWKKISIQGTDVAGFDKSTVECFNCHKMGHFARECRAPRSQERGRRENYRQGSKEKEHAPKALMAIDGVGWDWSFMANEEENHASVAYEEASTEFALMAKSNSDNEKEKDDLDGKLIGFQSASKDLDNLLESQRSDKNKEGLGYSVVPSPPVQVYSPSKKDMSWTRLSKFADDTITDYSRPSPAIESNSDDLQNRNPYVTETGASSSTILSKPAIKFVKAAERPTEIKTNKVETIKKHAVKYAKMYRKTSKSSNIMSLLMEDMCHLVKEDARLLAKEQSKQAFADECMLWHRRLCHLNIKTMNRLVRHNLVRGLPSKCFDNDHTYVACLKRKQHKASCKTKLVNSVTKPLYTLHMDLFGPTSDETSGILKNFITEIENMKDLKVKIIRCDNGGEFINKEMNYFCSRKEIKRDFSNARTPQQNGVAERRNRILIEAARTMTPYELFNGRSPAIGFLRPFGCHVMILNTLDHLGKFEAKGDEVVGAGTNSINFSGTKEATGQDVKKGVSFLRYIALPNWFHEAHLESFTSNAQYACNADAPESSGNSNLTATSINLPADHMETLAVETLIPTVSSPVSTACLNDSPKLSSDTRLISKRVTSQDGTPSLDNILTLTNMFEDILRVTTNTDDSNGMEADIGNMEYNISASPTLTFRIHKDHPKSQIIGPVDTPVQTRTKSKEMEEQSFIATIHQKTNPALLQFCLFSCFPSQEEPKKIFDTLKDPSWVRPIRIKWVLKNKKDEMGIMIRNKARLVAQGNTQEERIDYDEVFTPVARIEAIKLFLAYASFMGFTVYQIDMKSAFLYGIIDEEVYVMQPPGFQDLEFPARVYKVEKAMYGLHQAPRAWYGTLSKYLLTNGFQRGTIDQTLFIRRQRGDFILVQVYVDDIIFGSSNP
nr:hypothetical protein [Tanacetum cinerariifolium]